MNCKEDVFNFFKRNSLLKDGSDFLKSKTFLVATLPTAMVSVLAIASHATDPVDIATAMSTSLQAVQVQILGALAGIAPTALEVMGAFLCWRYGVKFFKGLAH
jgi:peptidoglycan hydrolase-like amidase